MTNILLAYTQLYPQTNESMARYAPDAIRVQLGFDKQDYWRAIEKYWTGEEALINIEQDIEIGPDTIASLESCPEPWCTYGYMVDAYYLAVAPGGIKVQKGADAIWQIMPDGRVCGTLGCAKISAEVQRVVPASVIWDDISNCEFCHGGWFHLDTHIADLLCDCAQQYRPHDHGDVTHHHKHPEMTEDLVLKKNYLMQAQCGMDGRLSDSAVARVRKRLDNWDDKLTRMMADDADTAL